MQATTVSEPIRQRILQRRGRLRVFERLDASRAALVIIDMQNVFCQPGGALEIPASRETAGNVNRLAAACRTAGNICASSSADPARVRRWKYTLVR